MVTPNIPIIRATQHNSIIGTVMRADGSLLSVFIWASLPGKNDLKATGSRYPAVSIADIRRITTGSTLRTPIPLEIVLAAITHLLRNPPIGGIPTRDKEAAVKPEYKGNGILVLEPTYKHIMLVDVEQWGSGITIEDGMFYACDGTVRQNLVSRRNISSATFGNEGLFNLSLSGHGIAALESNVPEEELITIELNNDEIRIDGDMAVCWSSNLQFTVEMSTRSIVGSAVSGEGLVNVYRGTGRVIMSPVARTESWSAATNK